MGKSFREHFRLSKAAVLILLIMAATAFGMNKISETSVDRSGLAKTAATPNTQNCSHRVGNVWFTITNWGFFGSQFQQNQLKEMYCLSPTVASGSLAPSFEFPAGTGVNYLFQGALWIVAIVGEDTLVSVGADGWLSTNEMYPQAAPNGGIIQKSNRRSSEFYSEDAISEQDF
ncbi:MAG: hypothetical protein E4G91_03080, partial [Candidatus Zixiibacteriota bacterium]